MKQLNMKTISLMVMGASLLTGCAATQQASDRFTDFKATTKNSFDASNIKSSAVGSASDDASRLANFGKTTRNWIDPNPLPRNEDKKVLPDIFRKNVSMTMPGTVNAPEVLSEMQRSTGIKFEIGTDIYDTTPGQGKIVTTSASNSQGAKPALLLIPDFVFRGTLEEALNLLAAKANISWKWNGREVEIFRYETKTYNIAALAGSTKTASNVDLKGDTSGSAASEGGGSAANSGTTSSSVSRNATLTTWDEVKTFLISQLSVNGSIAVLEATGAVTIKDVPAVHKRLDKSINDLNTLLTKQIFLNVDIYSVTVSDKDDTAIDWNLVWGGNRNSFGYNATGGAQVASNKFSVGVLTGPFAGSNVVMGALSSVGRTSVVNQFQVTTLNGQPTPIASNKKVGYLKEVKVTAGQGEQGPAYELIAGEISSGINLNIIPKLEPTGNILMEYTMNLSDIEGLRTFTAPNGAAIEIPTSNLKSVLQRASLRSGQTLVLSGFKQSISASNKAGVGSPNNLFLGGKQNAEVSDQYLVITVTPYVANNNAGFRR